MNKEKDVSIEKITPEKLLSLIGVTPADNFQKLSNSVAWKSKMTGGQVRGVFTYKKFLDDIGRLTFLGPLAASCIWQSSFLDTFVTGPVKAHAMMAAGSGRNPDLIADMNGWIYKSYARLLYTLTGFFIEDGRFSRQKAMKITTTSKGYEFLKNYMVEFAQLENSYSNIGLTRLAAIKELLKCLLVVITETPLPCGELPFAKRKADGELAASFEDYLAENRIRLENLYRENVFDIKDYSERVTGGKIGFSRYEYVEGSLIHRVRLRHYILPKGMKANGKIIYMTTPLINRPELFDLSPGKSVIEGMHMEGYHVYLIDHGEPGWEETQLKLDFYGKTVHDLFLNIIRKRHPRAEILVMAYCMGGTLILPYLARRAEERIAAGKPMDIKKVALMASPVKFDDEDSGHKPIRTLIRRDYDPYLMKELFGAVNIPPQVIESGMNEIQPGVQYNVVLGFYSRAESLEAIIDAAPFLYWLTHGTKFPVSAHVQWIQDVFIGNQIYEGKWRLPSTNPKFDGQPVNMDMLAKAEVAIFEYKGLRDPIAPSGSCVAAQIWGLVDDGKAAAAGKLRNRSIEKNVGHIFVGSRRHLADYLALVNDFYRS